MKIAILGGGISGLLTAFYIRKKCPHAQVMVFEQANKVGGIIDSRNVNGNIYEQAARGLRLESGANIIHELISDLDLQAEVIYSAKSVKDRYIYTERGLKKFSEFKTVLDKLSPLLAPEKGKKSDESVGSFISRHFGEDLKNNFFEPLVSGICAGHIDKISIKALFQLLFNPAHSKLKRGILTFTGGIKTLSARIERSIKDALRLQVTIAQIRHFERGFRIEYLSNNNNSRSTSVAVDAIISTLPAFSLSHVLQDSQFKDLSDALDKIVYSPMAIVSLGFEQKVHQLQGFGHLVPHTAGENILGSYWNDITFPTLHESSGSSFTVLLGGTRMKNFLTKTDQEFIRLATHDLQRQLKFSDKPIYQDCTIFPQALPQPMVGYKNTKRAIRNASPRSFFVSGNFVSGAGIHDIAEYAKNIATHLATRIEGGTIGGDFLKHGSMEARKEESEGKDMRHATWDMG